jgi:hypothetical protein
MFIIIPINDIKEHDEESTICECNPEVIFENGEMIIIHNAFDGRELEEQINKILGEDASNRKAKG